MPNQSLRMLCVNEFSQLSSWLRAHPRAAYVHSLSTCVSNPYIEEDEIVYELDKKIPDRRALGICHLVTFGPLFVWFSLNFVSIYEGWGTLGLLFVIEYCIIGLCLYLDLRDLVLEMCGLPFPCYVRDYHRKNLKEALRT
jgi:hypothetical protein